MTYTPPQGFPLFSDEYFMSIALQEAQKAYDKREIPIGAVVVSNNQVIAKAHNQVETLKDATAHAEMLALSAAFTYLGGKYLQNCTLYTTLEPCIMCASATFWSKITRIVFGAHDRKLGYRAFRPTLLHPKTSVSSSILSTSCQQIIESFFANLRK